MPSTNYTSTNEVPYRARPAYLEPFLGLTSSLLEAKEPTPDDFEASLTPSPKSPRDKITSEIVPPTVATPTQCETILSPLSELVVTILPRTNVGGILIEPFMSTSKLIPEIVISTFGTIFTPIKSDVVQNVGKIMDRYTEYEKKHSTVEALLLAELEKGEHSVDTSARVGVLWLNRTLHFIQVLFSGLGVDHLETSTALSRAYSVALMPYHNFIMRGLFTLLVHQAPTRADIVLTLCKGSADKEADNVQQMELIAGELARITRRLHEFYAEHGLD